MNDTQKTIDNIYSMMGEANCRRVDEHMYYMHHDQSLEKLRIGYIWKDQSYAVEVYSYKILEQIPHMTIVRISETGSWPIAKIALPPNDKSGKIDDLIILWEKDMAFPINARMKRYIKEWLLKINKEFGGTNLSHVWSSWNTQAYTSKLISSYHRKSKKKK
jgi:hypothetical protein